jgi:hypothetical protein
MEIIGIDNVLSLILVNEDVRPAFLYQPNFLYQSSGMNNDSMIETHIKRMREHFPGLYYSKDYENFQGILVSKKKYDNRKNITNEEMGKILGYPCYKEYSTLDRTKPYYTIDVVALSNIGEINIFTNICSSTEYKKKIGFFNKLAQDSKIAFGKKEYSHFFIFSSGRSVDEKEFSGEGPKESVGNLKDYGSSLEITDVNIKITRIIPPQNILEKLIRNSEFNKKEKEEVLNILFNLGFSMQFQFFFEDKFQYNNHVHRGILMTLLLNYINSVLEPFTPLYKYPEQDKQIEEINRKMESELTETIKKTRTHRIQRFSRRRMPK